MKSLGKIASLGCLLCSFFFGVLSAASPPSDHLMQENNLETARFFIQLRAFDGPHQTLANILDPYQTQMLALGIYSQQDVNQFIENALTHFYNTAGLDFSLSNPAVFHDPITDIRFLGSQAAMVPIFVGDDGTYNVLFDSGKPQKNMGSWTVRSSSLVAVYFEGTTIPAGTAAGQVVEPGDVFGYAFTDHLRKGSNWQLPPNRDHFVILSLTPGKEPINGFGITEQHVPLRYVDSDGNIGFGSDNVYVNKLDNTTERLINQHVVNFFVQ